MSQCCDQCCRIQLVACAVATLEDFKEQSEADSGNQIIPEELYIKESQKVKVESSDSAISNVNTKEIMDMKY